MSLAKVPADSLTSNLEYALYYSNLGWEVFPAHTIRDGYCSCGKSCKSPGKHPMTRNGLKDATTNHSQILKWWNKAPDANIAIRTGKESDLIVLDIDTKTNGFDSLEVLENTFNPLPDSLTSITGSKGKHICFKHPGGKIKTRAKLVDGIDFRADGGYIIAPPSLHISGNAYLWIDPQKPLTQAPAWLLRLVNDKGDSVTTDVPEIISEGERNTTLMSIAGQKWGQGFSKKKLQTFLLEENQLRCKPPLDHLEVLGIVDRVAGYKRNETYFIFEWRRRFMMSDLPKLVKLVLHTLSNHMDSQGRSCYPTQEQIAGESSMNLKTVRKQIQISIDCGWLEKYVHSTDSQKYWNYGYVAKIPDG